MPASSPADDVNRPLTYEDYALIPADGKRWEILDGDPHVNPAPGTDHQRKSRRLQRALEEYFEPRGGEVFNAPVDVILGAHDICQPDLVVVTEPSIVTARGIEGTPELLVEIASPSNRTYDRITKARRYAEAGVAHYWILDPELGTVDCFRNAGRRWETVGVFRRDEQLTHPAFPGLSIPLAAVWR